MWLGTSPNKSCRLMLPLCTCSRVDSRAPHSSARTMSLQRRQRLQVWVWNDVGRFACLLQHAE